MIWLIIVSLVWAFSFGLIKTNLSGLDSNFVTFWRLFFSLLIFVPFLRFKSLSRSFVIKLIFTGMVQYGLMYLFYIYSFQFLKAYEVALFTIFTPFFVVLIHSLLEKNFKLIFFINAAVSIIGTFIIVYTKLGDSPYLIGFLLVQLSNLSFAFGQIYYKKIMNKGPEIKDYQIFGLLYLGAVLLSFFPYLFTCQTKFFQLSFSQLFTLIYLGVLASGFCFFLWNYGARKVNAGTLGVMNNLKIPLAVLVSIFLFHESFNILKLLMGFGMILIAVFISEKVNRKNNQL